MSKIRKILSKLAAPGLVFLLASNLASVLNYGYQYINSISLKNGQFGSLGSFLSVIVLINALLVAPLQAELVRLTKKVEINKKVPKNFVIDWIKVLAVASVITFGISSLLLPFSNQLFGIESKLAFLFLIIYTSLSFIIILSRGILQGLEKFILLGGIILIEPTFRVLGAIINSFTFKSFIFISSAPTVGLIFAITVSMLILLKSTNNEKSEIDTKKYLLTFFKKEKFTILSISLLSSFFSVNLILAASSLNGNLADTYAKISLVGKTILFGAMPITMIFYPKFISHPEKSSELLKKGLLITAGVAILGSLPIITLPNLILGKFFNGLDEYYIESMFFLAASIVLILNNFLTYFSVARKRKLAVAPISLGLVIIIITMILSDNLLFLTKSYLIANIITFLGLTIIAFKEPRKITKIKYDT